MCRTTYDVRVKRFFPTVPDFARDEKGDIDWSSLSGPQKIEARQQLSRERMVAGAEVRCACLPLKHVVRTLVPRTTLCPAHALAPTHARHPPCR
ncbi:hypothetical protein EON66_02150 [archaeon]|nr:MAG: hypothetical protein EON66_02150 [archaeon]